MNENHPITGFAGNFIIFGACGNLATEKIYPALFALFKKDIFYHYLGYGRTKINDPAFKKLVQKSILKAENNVDNKKLNNFLRLFCYTSGEYNQKGLKKLKKNLKSNSNIFYLAVPSFDQLIRDIFNGLQNNYLINPQTKVVIEKPFGSDYHSAQKINHLLRKFLKEEQIYRIDHYLSRDLIRDFIALRFANPIFETVLNNHHVEGIRIEINEEIGIKNRGEFYDRTGAVRDMIQNHGLQLLALITMSRPKDLRAQNFRQEKSRILSKLRLFNNDYRKTIEIGQYGGYREEKFVDSQSLTETYAKIVSEVVNKRWKGVPIHLITGKKMRKKLTEVTILFKKESDKCLWREKGCVLDSNELIFNIYPRNDIRLKINSEFQRTNNCPRSIFLRFSFSDNPALLKRPYENSLLDLYRGDQSTFLSSKEILLSWKFIDPILEWIKQSKRVLKFY